MDQKYWQHDVGRLTLTFTYEGVGLTTTFHIADELAGNPPPDWTVPRDAVLSAWQNGYGGHGSLATAQTHNMSLAVALLTGPRAPQLVAYLLRTLTPLEWIGQSESDPVPPAICPITCFQTRIGGHAGVGYSALPYMGTALLDPLDPSGLSSDAVKVLEDGYESIRLAILNCDPSTRYRLCVFHRNGRYDQAAEVTRWWDEVLAFSVRQDLLGNFRLRMGGRRHFKRYRRRKIL